MTTVTAQDIVKIHTEKAYKEVDEYTGLFHPVNGTLAKFGLLTPLGYLMWAMGSIPSWAFMILISFFSRTFSELPNTVNPSYAQAHPFLV